MSDRPPAHRINAERIVVLGWIRAILLQLAHPLIAAGVAEHSTFSGSMTSALSRLHHTIGAMLALTFGDEAARTGALDGIRAIHRRVHGSLGAACGPFPAGTRYSAEDPELLLWVHATLIDSILRIYDRLIGPLAETDRDAYCADAAGVAIALGARPGDVPYSWRALQVCLESGYQSGTIRPCVQAQALASALLSPSSAIAARPLAAVLKLLAAGLLPDQVRHAYGFRWTRRHARTFDAAMATLRVLRRATPKWIAWWPDARRNPKAQVPNPKTQSPDSKVQA